MSTKLLTDWNWSENLTRMISYVPIFSKIVDSSLWQESDSVVKIFITMIAKKDRDNICRGSAFNIAKWSNKTEAEVLEALKVLSSPDTKRLEPQEFEGRRIQRVEEGWLILTGKFYQGLMQRVNRREYKTEKQREYRKDDKEPDAQQPHEKPKPSGFKAPTIDMCRLQAAKVGLPEIESDKFFDFYEAKGWMVGKNKMRFWVAAMSNWKRGYDEKRNGNSQQPKQSIDRNIGNANEGKAHLYKGLGNVSVPG